MAKTVEITGVLTSERRPTRNEFIIGTIKLFQQKDIEQYGHSLKIVGTAPPDELQLNLTYRFFGRIENDPKWGPQFKFDTFAPAKPHGRVGVLKYLQECPGIGIATATKIWSIWGSDSVQVCRERPEELAAKVPSLKPDECREISEFLKDQSALEDTGIDLIDLLAGRGFPKNVAREAMRVWGAKAPEVIKACPYDLMRFRGCGFQKCDKMYLDLGLPPDDMRRQVCYAWYCMSNNTDGHVWFPESFVIDAIKSKVSGTNTNPLRAIELAMEEGKLVTTRWCNRCESTGTIMARDLFEGDTMVETTCPHCRGTGGERFIAETHKAKNEEYVAEKLAEMTTWERHWPDIDGPAFSRLSDEQRTELKKATRGAVGILCGSPGAGKTFSVAALVKSLVSAGKEVLICAPTGKAAQRSKSAMREYSINVDAKTIHRTLEVEFADDGEWTFAHNEHNPLDCDFLLIDEMSMTSTALFCSLLRAVDRGTNVLMIGDVNQLLPVDYGAPLRDITAHLPYGELKKIHRNSGTIVRACAAIRDAKPIPLDSEIVLSRECDCNHGTIKDHNGETVQCPECEGSGKTPSKNLMLVEASQANAQRALLDLVKQLAASGKCDPIWDIQVCVAVNPTRSSLGRKTLNPLLQDILNPKGEGCEGSCFRVGDKVMQTKNEPLPLASGYSQYAGDDQKVMVCNGEFGLVLEVHPKKTIVQFRDPDRVVVIPKGKSYEAGDDNPDNESEGTGCNLVLGYAATVWKMQGSSAPYIVGCLDEYPGASGPRGNCDRAYCYTMISRGEKACYLVGQRSTLVSLCNRQFIWNRRTLMRELLGRKIKEHQDGRVDRNVDCVETAGGEA